MFVHPRRTAGIWPVAFVAAVFPSVAAAQAPQQAPAAAPQSDTRVVGDIAQVGDVLLATSCAKAVEPEWRRAVALLHSFFYEESRRTFEAVAAKDPGCAMAQWGIAMTLWHPLWAAPEAEAMQAGAAAMAKAKTIGGKTEVERGMIGALDAFYARPAKGAGGEEGVSCHGPTGGGDHPARAIAYERAMGALHASLPDDVEVTAFYALALLATAPPTDKTLKNQTLATSLLEPLYKAHPNHPGIIHYLIHGYDSPPVATKGLPAATAYARIAPRVPHALHMPSHIFTRLGMWQEVVASNMASAGAARDYAAEKYPGVHSFDELHALDYLIYGYLQTGQDALARSVVDTAASVRTTFPAVDFAVAYATGAIPARYALERRQWSEAAALTRVPSTSWELYPFGGAHLAFARAFGAARAGKLDAARAAQADLGKLAEGMTDPRQAYFQKQAQMQMRIVDGWLAYAVGQPEVAEKALREAADADELLGKHPVSPGSLLPAREVLADFLAERGQNREALAEYEATLKLTPRRFNSLFGAGRAAERSGQVALAAKYYTELTSMVAAGSDRSEVATARAFLDSHRNAAATTQAR